MNKFFRPLIILAALLQTASSILAQGAPPIIWQKSVDIDRINAVVFTTNSNTLISGGSDRLIHFWRASDGALLRTLNTNAIFRHESAIESLAITSDGRTLATGTSNYVQLFDLPTGTERKILASQDWIVGVAISPDNLFVASASFDKRVKIFQISSGTLVKTLTNHTGIVRAVAYSPDGSLLASCSDDRTIRLWRTSDWTLVRTMSGHNDDLYSLAFSPDGTTVTSGSYDNTAKVWNVSDGTLKYTFSGSGDIYGVAYSPDASKLAFVDGTGNHLKLYNLQDGSLIHSYDVNDAQCVTFARSGLLSFGITARTVYVANILGSTPPPVQSYSLQKTVSGSGTIQVNTSPNGPNGTYLAGTTVSLTAVPTTISSGLIRWSGAANSTAKTISILMDGNKNITANFAISQSSLYWQNDNGQLAIWYMNGTSLANASVLNQTLPNGWKMVGQFLKNGNIDFLMQSDEGQLAVWFMNGATLVNAVYLQNGQRVPVGWRVVGLNDFDGDGNVDFLWQNSGGPLAVWYMDSDINLIRSVTLGTQAPAGWHIRGLGNFNSSGTNDILWQNDNGLVAVWYMNGIDFVGSAYLNNSQPVSSVWRIVGVNDFDKDGKSDILWQHVNGYSAIWFMNNAELIAGTLVSDTFGVPSSWHLTGAK